MKTIWILLVFVITANGTTISQHDFGNAAACEKAVEWYKSQGGFTTYGKATCIPDQRP